MDQTELTSLFVSGRIFIFLVGEIVLTDNLQLIYRVTRWKNSTIRLLEDPVAVVPLEERFKKMKCSTLSMLTAPVIFRNYYKFRVVKVDLRFLYFKVSCSQCKGNIIRVAENEHCCRECGPVRPRLLGWAIVGVMDHTGEAELTIEDDALLDFFGLEQEWPRLID